jgi:hypothetical protein
VCEQLNSHSFLLALFTEESKAFVVPGFGKIGIQPGGLIISLEGLIVLAPAI